MELIDSAPHWLRPWWFLGLPLWWWLVWAWRRQSGVAGAWQQAVDAHLLPFLLERVAVRASRAPAWLALLAGSLGIVALAGPSWRESRQPLWQREAPLAIALELSAAMRAADLPPSRLVQARAKLKRLLETRRAGQVGLLAFAGDAFVVAPVTRDARTVVSMLDTLTPDLMPVEGQRADRAILQALKMLRATGADSGEILLLADHADAAAQAAAAEAARAGFRVSVLGLGTLAGAPMSGANGFLTGADGQPLLARLEPASLSALARSGGGRYAQLASDDSDLHALGVLDPAGAAAPADGGTARDPEEAGRVRSDDGYWLLLVLLPLALLGFRRGWLALLPLALMIGLAGHVPEARADTAEAESSWWEALWQRADQRSHAALRRGDAAAARALAPDPERRAAAAYREQDYAAAASEYARADSADAHYNRGNALAQAGKLEEALAAYDRALEREPGMPDALANRQLVEDLLKQQQEQKQDQQQDSKQDSRQDSKQDSQQGQPQGQQQQSEQQGEQQQGEQQQGEQQHGEQQQGEQQQGEQQQGEQQQGEQQQGEEQQGQQQGQQGGKQSGEQPEDPEAAARAQTSAEAAEQQVADQAQRERMQQALEQSRDLPPGTESVPLTAEQRERLEQQQATEQLLRRVPDDPGALLRRKFQLEYQRRLREGGQP